MPKSNAPLNLDIYREGLVPLVVGVTGHRDLRPEDVPAIRARVGEFLASLKTRFPERRLQLLSPLAEGADQLVAEVALDQAVTLTVPLPMPRDDYLASFETRESRLNFERLCARADTVIELSTIMAAGTDDARSDERTKKQQYAQLGIFLSAHCHILLALWDGKPSSEIGGTSEVIRFHHDDVMTGIEPTGVNRLLLVDDDSDLVYHIVVSRNRPDGSPLSGLQPLSSAWFTCDHESPRTRELPQSYVRVFERTNDFNRMAREHCKRIAEESTPLIDDAAGIELPIATKRIDHFFRAADWLATRYQRRNLLALRITHTLAFLMGVLFLLYSNVEATRLLMAIFLTCFVATFTLHAVAAKGKWHSKYLEYRALAEGLRVQLYWSAAGVTSDSTTKYSHDNFLQKQDSDLGWIQNVMRVAGMSSDATPYFDHAGLDFTVKSWIGSEMTGGQVHYFRSNTSRYIRKNDRLNKLARLVSVLVVTIVAATALVDSDHMRNLLFMALGALLLAFGVRQAFAYRVAEKELIKQYSFMYTIFGNARQRLLRATDDEEKRRILRALGEAALDEHAEWIFLHRERPPDPEGMWRMEP